MLDYSNDTYSNALILVIPNFKQCPALKLVGTTEK